MSGVRVQWAAYYVAAGLMFLLGALCALLAVARAHTDHPGWVAFHGVCAVLDGWVAAGLAHRGRARRRRG